MSEHNGALLELLHALRAHNYNFITPTPLTHLRVIARDLEARDLRDIFGWSKQFHEAVAPRDIFALMARAEILERRGDLFASTLRVSSLGAHLLLHSAFPTLAQDSVFFGPDSYRFAAFVRNATHDMKVARRIADIGAGAGAGGICAGTMFPSADLVLTDINPRALRLARINAAFAGLHPTINETSALDGVEGAFDLIIANPPYIADDEKRAYRDGGAMIGGQVSLDWTEAALAHLAPGGRFLLYTGSAIIQGEDRLAGALRLAAQDAGCTIDISEIDPDVFGEELLRDAYRRVERIAVIGAVFTKP